MKIFIIIVFKINFGKCGFKELVVNIVIIEKLIFSYEKWKMLVKKLFDIIRIYVIYLFIL